MDFFSSQETARKQTKLLLCYFALAVIGLTVSLYGVVVVAEHFMSGKSRSRGRTSATAVSRSIPWWNPTLFLWSSLGTLGIVSLGSGYKMLQLSGGGRTVARDLGGRLVSRDTQQPDERRLLNVVEEMALAAGMPVPDVYLMDDEDGINAFAAGHTPGDAVIGVTRGTIRTLSRDELQGVMAHEFSHILNGDMRLNLRLIGWVHGILIIALLGQILLRLAMETRGGRDEKGGGRLAFMAVGAAIMGIGYLGVLFANLIKAAISRQREFLADASAVQFTRNPDGIGGALLKIGGLSSHSYIQSAGAEVASHMLFGPGKASTLFDSHPALEERIRRIQPSWDGKYPQGKNASDRLSAAHAEPVSAAQERRGNFAEAMHTAAMGAAAQVAQAAQASQERQSPGSRVSPEDLVRARGIQSSLPQDWRQLLCDPTNAQAMMFALILSEDPDLLAAESHSLQQAVDEELLALTMRLHGEVQDRPSAQLIAVIDLAIPALRRLSLPEYQQFTTTLDALMASDQKIDLFEFMVQKILRRHLDLWFRQVPPPQTRFKEISQLLPEAQSILSTLAGAGGADDEASKLAYAAAQACLPGLPADWVSADLPRFDLALDRFEMAAPRVKQQLLQACGQAVMADRAVVNEEAELLRAIADTIGCPVPPLAVAA
jgi:Zn-dependent protease with chaperone function